MPNTNRKDCKKKCQTFHMWFANVPRTPITCLPAHIGEWSDNNALYKHAGPSNNHAHVSYKFHKAPTSIAFEATSLPRLPRYLSCCHGYSIPEYHTIARSYHFIGCHGDRNIVCPSHHLIRCRGDHPLPWKPLIALRPAPFAGSSWPAASCTGHVSPRGSPSTHPPTSLRRC